MQCCKLVCGPTAALISRGPGSAPLPAAQEDDQTKEAKQHQLLEEDIDAILARAEVRGLRRDS